MLLIQLRLLADQNGDTRSLVAIAAQFERDSISVLNELRNSINKKRHNRNEAA
jgi:hypothetical protein